MLQRTRNWGYQMTKLLTVVDRVALAMVNILVVAGLPLAAVGLMTNAI